MPDKTAKRILVAPLDWGLGHATRCIPVIRELLRQKHEVILATDGACEHLLLQEFPDLQFIKLRGYRLTYSTWLPAWLKIFFQLPGIGMRAMAEHISLKKIISEHRIDLVISDNRFGMWNKKVPCIYMTHQVMIKCPPLLKFFEPFISKLHRTIIHNYSRCWIPDFEGEQNLSGDLARRFPSPANAKFIGLLSRFGKAATAELSHDLCIILSGPEPARSDFEKIVADQLESFAGKAVFILGRPGKKHSYKFGPNIEVQSHLGASAMEKIISGSRMVLCRPGYSGIMDLIALRKDAVLVPTPGQTEQEYLAGYLSGKKVFRYVKQNRVDLAQSATGSGEFSVRNFIVPDASSELLRASVSEISNWQ